MKIFLTSLWTGYLLIRKLSFILFWRVHEINLSFKHRPSIQDEEVVRRKPLKRLDSGPEKRIVFNSDQSRILTSVAPVLGWGMQIFTERRFIHFHVLCLILARIKLSKYLGKYIFMPLTSEYWKLDRASHSKWKYNIERKKIIN